MITQGNALYMPIGSEKVGMVITSPPYYNARMYSQWASYDKYLSDMYAVWLECWRVLEVGGRIAINVPQGYDRPGRNGGYKTLEADITQQLKRVGFEIRGHIIWDKVGTSPQSKGTAWGSWLSSSNPSLRDGHEIIVVAHKIDASRSSAGRISTITRDDFLHSTRSMWRIPAVSGNRHWHPAPFPEEIPRRLIELYTFLGDVVLDPFSGSGTTEQVACALGRVGIGIELDYGYIRKSFSSLLSSWEHGRGIYGGNGDSPDPAPEGQRALWD